MTRCTYVIVLEQALVVVVREEANARLDGVPGDERPTASIQPQRTLGRERVLDNLDRTWRLYKEGVDRHDWKSGAAIPGSKGDHRS